MNIADMNVYIPEAGITADQFNNLVTAVAKSSLTVELNAALSAADRQSLTRANLLMSGSTVSREAGISAMVRLYEIKTGVPVYQPTLGETRYHDIAQADPIYQPGLLKAVNLSFLGDAANPKGALTMGDAFYMVDIIWQDEGL
jgi:hypothetical protein